MLLNVGYNISSWIGRCLNKFKIDPYFLRFLLKSKKIIYTEEEILSKLEKYHSDLGGSSIRKKPQKINIKYDIQIIIPVYNVEEYLEQCLDSILNQKFNGSYIITIVNDGSTDNSGLILKKYESNPHCEIITKENGGLSSARNKALDEIKGQYLFFIDSDDLMPENTLQSLFDEAIKTNNNIIYGPYKRIDRFNNVISIYHPRKDKINGCICGKLYKSSIFENLIFPDKYWFEDTIVAMLMGPYIKDYSYINNVVYSYRANENGISLSAIGNVRMLDTVYITRRLIEDLTKCGKLNIDSYETFLDQVIMNRHRIYSLKNIKLIKLVFQMHCLLIKKFSSYKTKNKKFRLLEWSLINNNFAAYIISF